MVLRLTSVEVHAVLETAIVHARLASGGEAGMFAELLADSVTGGINSILDQIDATGSASPKTGAIAVQTYPQPATSPGIQITGAVPPIPDGYQPSAGPSTAVVGPVEITMDSGSVGAGSSLFSMVEALSIRNRVADAIHEDCGHASEAAERLLLAGYIDVEVVRAADDTADDQNQPEEEQLLVSVPATTIPHTG